MTPIYRSGKCTVITYGPFWHELWYDYAFIANFRAFRDAVTYIIREFE